MKANAQKIADGVYWIGVLDWDLRMYHGYTLDGTTYNAYLVFGEDEVALIDNAYPGKTKETQIHCHGCLRHPVLRRFQYPMAGLQGLRFLRFCETVSGFMYRPVRLPRPSGISPIDHQKSDPEDH